MKRPAKESPCYETRYRYKLNMLWPGGKMMMATGVLAMLGGMMYLIHWHTLAYVAFTAAAVIFAVLLILVAIELHQDRILNEIAMGENKKEL